jgi:predicted ferric reductase
VRESGHFEWFHRSHLLYPAWLALALLHGQRLRYWLALPLALFCIDRFVRFRRGQAQTRVRALTPLPGGVTQVTLHKPAGFEHRAGDYAYLRLPDIASHEWHPFTISSAPERAELTFHVRTLGDFTRSLYDLAEQRADLARAVGVGNAVPGASEVVLRDMPAYLDGPFGSASGDIAGSEVAVLVGAGIGVTPFASVLESLVLRHGTTRLKKVYFYWLNRDGSSFEWFGDLLSELEAQDVERLVDIRIFMTRGRARSTSTVLNLARSVAQRRGDPDLVTGLRTRTNMGSPNWHRELTRIAQAHGSTPVDVYFCGPPGLAWTLRYNCARLRLKFRQEHF